MEELYEFDNKINELLLNKILAFENENKVLKEKNKSIQNDIEVLKNSMKNAQNDSEKLRQNYKKLQQDEKDLVVKLKSTNKAIHKNEADFPKTPPRKRSKTTEENIENHNITSNSHLINEGLLVIRYFYLR